MMLGNVALHAVFRPECLATNFTNMDKPIYVGFHMIANNLSSVTALLANTAFKNLSPRLPFLDDHGRFETI